MEKSSGRCDHANHQECRVRLTGHVRWRRLFGTVNFSNQYRSLRHLSVNVIALIVFAPIHVQHSVLEKHSGQMHSKNPIFRENGQCDQEINLGTCQRESDDGPRFNDLRAVHRPAQSYRVHSCKGKRAPHPNISMSPLRWTVSTSAWCTLGCSG